LTKCEECRQEEEDEEKAIVVAKEESKVKDTTRNLVICN
jgi:hypothetical protein